MHKCLLACFLRFRCEFVDSIADDRASPTSLIDQAVLEEGKCIEGMKEFEVINPKIRWSSRTRNS